MIEKKKNCKKERRIEKELEIQRKRNKPTAKRASGSSARRSARRRASALRARGPWMHVYMYTCVISIYIYIYRERERLTHVYIYIYTHTHTYRRDVTTVPSANGEVDVLSVSISHVPRCEHLHLRMREECLRISKGGHQVSLYISRMSSTGAQPNQSNHEGRAVRAMQRGPDHPEGKKIFR